MSKLICGSAIDGAVEWVARADHSVARAIEAHGEERSIGFPSTAYHLPIIYSLSEHKVETLADCRAVLRLAKDLLPQRPSEEVWLPYLGSALDAGVATLFACEIIEACKYLNGDGPVGGIWLGAASDVIIRERGIEFVDGTAPGFAAIAGAAPTNEIAVRIARDLQEKNIYVFMAGSTDGRQFAEQLAEEGVQLGWETRLVPYGKDVSALVYALGFANRVALSFGNVAPADFEANLKYNKDRVFAFVMPFGEVDAQKYAVAAGAINYGFPIIADTDIPEILPTGVCTYEHVISNVAYETMVEKALEVRGCKVRITDVPVPVPYGPAFEGERIRKSDIRVEFGGNRTPAFEYVTTVGLEEINDGEIEVVGPEVEEVEERGALPLAIWVEVAGRKMQVDFEPILERQVHHFLNGASGLWHMGQRDIVWTRISNEAFGKGLRLEHYGRILHAKILAEYGAIVDKVKVTLFTEIDEVERRQEIARKVYDQRNRRLEAMTDESVDTFYSCLLCQSFAPNHVCIITPERLGLCGAYNWLDGKAAYEIAPTGANQPVQKGECLDPVKGVWSGVDEYVYINSHKALESFSAYSIMDRPMTSCGCFEVICGYVPECNGIMAVNREFEGDTPVGMDFSTLAGEVGGGRQTPGFMGCGKIFLTSRKFLFADGGSPRLIWMPKELKELLADDLEHRFDELGIADMLDKIADETIATDPQQIRSFMENVGHPALEMEDMADFAQQTEDEALLTQEKLAQEPTVDSSKSKEPVREDAEMTPEQIAQLKKEVVASVAAEVREELKQTLTREIVGDIIGVLSRSFLGGSAELATVPDEKTDEPAPRAAIIETGPTAAERVAELSTFEITKERCEQPVWTVALGAGPGEGGTRGTVLKVGGATAMPFHLWEGEMPHRPLVALEVFDVVSEKHPPALRQIFGHLLEDPPEMARTCVERYGADLISVRLEGTHPEKGNRTPEQAVELVKNVLDAVDVPLIVTGHSHFEAVNEVLKAVAQACHGENLLLNWVEQDNYRTIAGTAIAYGHTVVAQNPIDVNIGKQMNILLTGMSVPIEQIVMDPMTGAMGYGLEYTYSVMERIRLSGLGGDAMLAGPMIVSPGQETAKIKEVKAPESNFPSWGDIDKRAVLWELSCATTLLYAGADILIMYHPDAAMATKDTIFRLMDGRG
ncbi:MAG: CO dehydrogenase/CO-methylating acetyl-CoA synthase complex subunit beta [Acidobacteria bacterium]|nr:CO dehydrogenase/CO-methylating acetyl-CoA synthase complex subunit beta [Candidatus Sulfomarinibacter sp. MAG AM1]